MNTKISILGLLFVITLLIASGCCEDDEALIQPSIVKNLTLEIANRTSISDENHQEALLLSRSNGEIIFIKKIEQDEIVEYEFLGSDGEVFNLFWLQSNSSDQNTDRLLINSFLDIEVGNSENWKFSVEPEPVVNVTPQALAISITTGTSAIKYLNIIQPGHPSPYRTVNPSQEFLQNIFLYTSYPSEKIILQVKEENSNIWKGFVLQYEEGEATDIDLNINEFTPMSLESIEVEPDVDVAAVIAGRDTEGFNTWWLGESWTIKHYGADTGIADNEYLLMDYGFNNYYSSIRLRRGNEIHQLLRSGSEIPASFLTAPIDVNFQGNNLMDFQVESTDQNTFFKSKWIYSGVDSQQSRAIEILWSIEGRIGEHYKLPEIRDCLSLVVPADISTADFEISSLGEEEVNNYFTDQGWFKYLFKEDDSYLPYSQWLAGDGVIYRGYEY
jgi:hypothetical protein